MAETSFQRRVLTFDWQMCGFFRSCDLWQILFLCFSNSSNYWGIRLLATGMANERKANLATQHSFFFVAANSSLSYRRWGVLPFLEHVIPQAKRAFGVFECFHFHIYLILSSDTLFLSQFRDSPISIPQRNITHKLVTKVTLWCSGLTRTPQPSFFHIGLI